MECFLRNSSIQSSCQGKEEVWRTWFKWCNVFKEMSHFVFKS